jgi:hypothetical protein
VQDLGMRVEQHLDVGRVIFTPAALMRSWLRPV